MSLLTGVRSVSLSLAGRRGTNDTVESSESGAWMSGAAGNGERRGTTDSEASDRFSRKGLQAGSHLSMSAFSPLAASASHDNDYDDGVAGEARDGQGAGGEQDVASPSGAADDLPSETPFSIEVCSATIGCLSGLLGWLLSSRCLHTLTQRACLFAAHSHPHAHTHPHIYIHTNTNTRTHPHEHTHTHSHKHTHTFTHTLSRRWRRTSACSSG